MDCRLCLHNELTALRRADTQRYYLCRRCGLIGVHPEDLPARAEEKERYLLHENGPDHAGYRAFLSRAIDPAMPFLRAGMKGLDYGCGHTPTLSGLLQERSLPCDDYDPLFFPNKPGRYDFIFSTEVFEHFFEPRRDIAKITGHLNPGGLLIVMTERYQTIEQFADWYYPSDPTHVAFYHDDTFRFIRETYNFETVYDDGHRLIILRKN
jgi:SAM-dependent methyltransferase